MTRDLHHALRSLRAAKGVVFLSVVCLGLGIGATTTVFSAVNTLLLRPLPFREPGGVMLLHTTHAGRGVDDPENLSYREFVQWGNVGGAFTATGAFTNDMVNLGGVDEPERLKAARVSASLFPLLGLAPVLGRTFRPEEDLRGGTVVLSHALWQRRFGGDRGAVGRVISVDGVRYTVVGVMQPGIRFPEIAELWLPLEPGEAAENVNLRRFDVIGRLAPGVSLEQARSAVAAQARRMAEQYPETHRGRGAWVQPYRELFSRQVRPMMGVMLAAVLCVLLIACANVANLLLAHGLARRREIAVRMAMGGSRGRIVSQLLIESLAIALAAGVLGALLGTWGIRAVASTLPAELPFWMVFDVDRTVLALTLAASLGSVVVFGLLPALRAADLDLASVLKSGGRGTTDGPRGGRLRGSLVVGQLALSLVLLAGATLMMRSFVLMQTADPGFRARGVLTMQTSLQGARYSGDSAVLRTYDALLARLAALPGVEAAGGVSQLPVASCCSSTAYYPEGAERTAGEAPYSLISVVTPGYRRALGITLLAGRDFDSRDRAGAPLAAMVNRAFAESAWPGENPLGKRFRLSPDDTARATVVGVLASVKQRSLTEPDRAQLYLPHAQAPARTLSLVVRTSGDPAGLAPAVRQAVRGQDPDLPVSSLSTMDEVVRQRIFEPRVYGGLFAAFAAVALLLAAVGLYGVVSYGVAQRRHEVGVRIALGASPSDVVRLVVGGGARLVALGLLLGVPTALLFARALRGALYGVSASDPATFASISVLLAAIALAATWLPARRAARVDPSIALRSE